MMLELIRLPPPACPHVRLPAHAHPFITAGTHPASDRTLLHKPHRAYLSSSNKQHQFPPSPPPILTNQQRYYRSTLPEGPLLYLVHPNQRRQ